MLLSHPEFIQPALIALVVIGGFLYLLLTQKKDTTTPEDIYKLSEQLRNEIDWAEEIVGRSAPHSEECRQLLDRARYCLHFSGASTRLVVSAGMIKAKREEGIRSARKAAEIARSSV